MLQVFIVMVMVMGSVWSRPDVEQKIYERVKDGKSSTFLVTFEGASTLVEANDSNQMYLMALTGKMMVGASLEEFVHSGQWNEYRGFYVYDQVNKHHRETMEHIKKTFPRLIIIDSIPISNSFLVQGNEDDLKDLEGDNTVVEVHSNDSFSVQLPHTQKSRDQPFRISGRYQGIMEEKHRNVQWNIAKINADKVWALSGSQAGRGQGSVYAIADTGVDFEHPNIVNNYLGKKNTGKFDHNYAWFDGVRRNVKGAFGNSKCGVASPLPCDDQGHGTHVTSIAVGADGYGVAPGAQWMACRNMDRGVGSPETYLRCLNFFLAPHRLDGSGADPSKRPHAIGNSYGCPDIEGCSKGAMNVAVEAVRAAGIFMSVSAGNDGPFCQTISDPPAIERSVVSVGATDVNDILAPFSSRGPCQLSPTQAPYRKPDVSAPGVNIQAAYPGGRFQTLSGTSMASPHVGAAVTIIQAMCPCMSRKVGVIEGLLESTAKALVPQAGQMLCGDDYENSVPNNHFGWGRIDLLEAIESCTKMCETLK